jgi:hypothetical protein
MTLIAEHRADPVTDAEDAGPSHEEVYVLVAAVCAMLAGTIHLAVVPQHWSVSWQISAFFVVLGVGQLGLGAALRWRLPPVVLTAVVVGHLAVMGLYVASRTADLPFVPPHDAAHEVNHLPVPGGVGNGLPIYPGSRMEPVGVLDVACLIAELGLVVMVVGLLPSRWRTGVTSAMLGVGVLAVVARGIGLVG